MVLSNGNINVNHHFSFWTCRLAFGAYVHWGREVAWALGTAAGRATWHHGDGTYGNHGKLKWKSWRYMVWWCSMILPTKSMANIWKIPKYPQYLGISWDFTWFSIYGGKMFHFHDVFFSLPLNGKIGWENLRLAWLMITKVRPLIEAWWKVVESSVGFRAVIFHRRILEKCW